MYPQPCFAGPPLVDTCFTLALVPATYDSWWKYIWNPHLYSSFLRKLPNLAVLLAPWPLDRYSEPGQMGGGNELHHQIVQCLKNVGFGMRQVLSCALPRIRGRCSLPGQGSEVSVFLAEAPKPVLSPQHSSLPGGVSQMWNQRSCARRERSFPTQHKNKSWRVSLGRVGVQSKAKNHELTSTWQELRILRTARSKGKWMSRKSGGRMSVIRNT